MPRKAYIALSLKHRQALDAAIRTIVTTLANAHIESQIFVDEYHFTPDEAQTMMTTACAAIRACDILIAELTHKAIGVGVEVGYAAALNKPIIYLRHADAEYSTTVGGLASVIISYRTTDDLATQLTQVLATLKLDD